MGAGAIAAQRRLLDPVGIDQHRSLDITLAGAFRDRRRNSLVCEIRGNALRLKETLCVGLAHENSCAERG